MTVTRISITVLLVVTASCASHHKRDVPDTDGAFMVLRPDRQNNVITSQELQEPSIVSRDAYTAIRHLRPNFFTYHGPNSFMQESTGSVKVSADYGPLQEVKQLQKMNTFGLTEVRYLNAEEAQGRFGLNANGSPVIVLLYNKGEN